MQKTDQSLILVANRQKNINISKAEWLLFITNYVLFYVNNFNNYPLI